MDVQSVAKGSTVRITYPYIRKFTVEKDLTVVLFVAKHLLLMEI